MVFIFVLNLTKKKTKNKKYPTSPYLLVSPTILMQINTHKKQVWQGIKSHDIKDKI